MIAYSASEILYSALYAFVYGAIYYLFYTIISFVYKIVYSLDSLIHQIFNFDKIFERNGGILAKKTLNSSALTLFLGVILFSLGFVILSYFALDGAIRLYMIIISSAAFFVMKKAFSTQIDKIFSAIFDFLFLIITILCRLILLPIKIIVESYNKINNKI